MRLLAAIATTTLVMTRVSDARAETFSLSIVDPVGCTERQDLVEQVTARAKGASFLASGGQWNFLLRFERSSHKIVAELHIRDPDNSPLTRVVDGVGCQEVTSAVALIMALALDPRGGSADSQPELVTGATDAPVTADAARAATAHSPSGPADAPAIAQRPARVSTVVRAPIRGGQPLQERDLPQRAASPKGFPWRVGIGAELKWTTLFTNKGMWLLGLRGEGAKARLFTVIQAALGPKVVRDAGNGTSAAYSFYGVGVELGTPIMGTSSLAADAMIAAAIGGLHFVGVQQGPVTSPRDATATWIGIGPGLRLRWFGETASLAFETTLPINVVRPNFAVLGTDGSEQVLYQAPAAGIFFGLCGTWNVEPSTNAHQVIKSDRGGD